MRLRLAILASIIFMGILAGCTSVSTPTPGGNYPREITVTPSPVPSLIPTLYPTWTPLPTSTITLSPYAVGDTTIWATPFPPELTAVLPWGAVPIQQLSWEVSSGCGQDITIIPFMIGEDHQRLAAVKSGNGYSLVWDWQQETVGPDDWKEIRPLPSHTRISSSVLFLGLDFEGQWWLAYVSDFCHTPTLIFLVRVSKPDYVFLARSQFSHVEDAPVEFWVIDNGVLNVYHWENNLAVKHWSLEELPSDALSLREIDVTGEGIPEWILLWYWQSETEEWYERLQVFQILKIDNGDFSVVGEVALEMQEIDLEYDNVIEFLQPLEPPDPQQWIVYRWMGDHYDWGETLMRPTAFAPQTPDPETLPAIPLDFYFSSESAFWRWPRQGGPLQVISELPPQTSDIVCEYRQVTQKVISWSPYCNYAVVYIPGQIEGGGYKILHARTGQLIDIPNSFVYTGGHSTFAWDPQEQFVVHARADGAEGLFQIDLDSGHVRTLLGLSNTSGWDSGQYNFGAVAPFVLQDRSVIFTVQGAEKTENYPPLGVYRITQEGQLSLLADIPALQKKDARQDHVYYGELSLSPDGSMYLYQAPLIDYPKPPYGALILGMTDGSASWSLLEFADAKDFQWSSQ